MTSHPPAEEIPGKLPNMRVKKRETAEIDFPNKLGLETGRKNKKNSTTRKGTPY